MSATPAPRMLITSAPLPSRLDSTGLSLGTVTIGAWMGSTLLDSQPKMAAAAPILMMYVGVAIPSNAII